MPRILIEAAVDSVTAAERAVREGADRLEVCGSLDVGGVTPSRELLGACVHLGVPCMAMARPRPGDFIYSTEELAALAADIRTVLDDGAHGVVFGILASDLTVDTAAVRHAVALCGAAESVFHRAIDLTPDAGAALDVLIDCRVTRVLTSGHAATASQGTPMLATLIDRARGRIQVLPGGGVRESNVGALVRRARTMQVHARATTAGVIAGIRRALDREEQKGE